jgi:hypothetical protein
MFSLVAFTMGCTAQNDSTEITESAKTTPEIVDTAKFTEAEVIAIVEIRLISMPWSVKHWDESGELSVDNNNCLWKLRYSERWPSLAAAKYEGNGSWFVQLGDSPLWSWRVFELSGASTYLGTSSRSC